MRSICLICRAFRSLKHHDAVAETVKKLSALRKWAIKAEVEEEKLEDAIDDCEEQAEMKKIIVELMLEARLPQ